MSICPRLLSSASLVFLALSAIAQHPVQPSTQQSAQTPAQEALEKWRDSKAATLRDDFGELARYRAANAALKPPVAGESRVVFFGDSITDLWHLDEYFPGKPYINRGIGGQTTPQMLIRFRQDVIDLQPKVVVILAGTNDIAGNTGPERIEDWPDGDWVVRQVPGKVRLRLYRERRSTAADEHAS